ncbi:MAG: ABC transporter ATP-binding protein [Bacillota bacterium]|nr:ABC transporter ATP-binding protein [Bacillota bacterium]
MEATPVISLRSIVKTFPGVVANRDINLDITHEIHAIVGENGAGKSTLMKILCGLSRPDSGEIWLRGRRVVITGPGHASALGIGMVHQHFMLVGRFSVAENVILGMEPSRRGVLDIATARSRVLALCRQYGMELDPNAKIQDLSVGLQQRVEILKVLYRGAEVLILDEPTAVLAPQEVSDLFANLQALKQSGKTIVFISHKLDEVLEIADRISVLRRGQMIGTVQAQSTTREEIASMMVGRPVLFSLAKPPAEPGAALLDIRDLSVLGGLGNLACDNVSLSVRSGEIYGIAGVEGNGQTELVEAVTGIRKPRGGSITLLGKQAMGLTPAAIRQLGLAHIPEDRHKRGLVLEMSVLENFLLGKQRRSNYVLRRAINAREARSQASRAVKEFDVRVASLDVTGGSLSGGNQQKLILSRELETGPKVIIAAQPMRGLDVGASQFVRSVLLKARQDGCAILLVSADLEELMALSDRIGVMFRGRLVAELDRDEATVERVGQYMVGTAAEVAR